MKNNYEIRGDVTIIFLNRNDGSKIETQIDTEDLAKVSSFPNTWVAQHNVSTKKFYVKGSYGSAKERKVIHLHRLVTDCPNELVTDHINWDPLDNRKINLRLVTQTDNLKHKKVCYNDEKGIYFDGKKWTAFFRKNGIQTYVGRYSSKISAKEAIIKFNEIGISSKATHKRKGSIGWHKGKAKWQVRITNDGKQKHIGLFINKNEAENALKQALNEL